MNKYTIYCTKAQTKRAFEFGAPIKANKDYSNGNLPETLCVYGDIVNKDDYGVGECIILHIPTAEQMCGWLEGKGLELRVIKQRFRDGTSAYIFAMLDNDGYFIPGKNMVYPSRPEATLAVIDTALEYLSNKP